MITAMVAHELPLITLALYYCSFLPNFYPFTELDNMIHQTSALEETIETLLDKVWNLEEMNANLECTIRKPEESAEIAAEIEEVQAEELKIVF